MDANASHKKRGTYGRPCDLCASRRVRCDVPAGSTSCKKCMASNLPCTHDRVRLKSGPKNGRKSFKAGEAAKSKGSMDAHAPKRSRLSPLDGPKAPERTQTKMGSPLPEFSNPTPQAVFDGLQPVDTQTTLPPQPDSLTVPPQPDSLTVPPQSSSQAFFSPYMPQLQDPRFSTSLFAPAGDMPQQIQAPSTAQSFPSPTPRDSFNMEENAINRFGVKASCEEENQIQVSPKDILTTDSTSADSSGRGGSGPHAKLSLENLLSRLQVYQTWFYGYWPILSVAELISVISDGAQLGYEDNFITLTSKNALSYSLCCAVCAAITTQLSFVSTINSSLNCNAISANAYAREAKRVRDLFDYRDNPNMNTLLISFFLYAHYVNTPGKTQTANIYLREAISIGQILSFHTPEFLQGKSRAETHRWKKIYYTLLVTERYMCFECGIPVILEPCVQFPDLDDEEYPSLINAFTELVKVFSAPGKEFFGQLNKHTSSWGELAESTDKKKWISAVQSQLHGNRNLSRNVTQSQRLNIILSEAWIRAIAWQITSDDGMLRSSCHTDDCFSYEFPIFNVRSFLQQTSGLPEVAFETNGPGVYVKLMALANTLTSSIPKLAIAEKDGHLSTSVASKLQDLESLFFLITKFKNEITVKSMDYQAISNFLFQSKIKNVPRVRTNCSQIEEICDDNEEKMEDQGENLEDSEDSGISFFQSMNSLKNFGTSPKFGSNVSLSAFMHDMS